MCRSHEAETDGISKPNIVSDCVKADKVVNQALNAAVHAFSARWLPLIAGTYVQGESLNVLARKLWLDARGKILLILQNRSYRSVLALYIFGMTPLPPGLDDTLPGQGSIGDVCIDVAMRHLQSLRVRRPINKFSSAAIVLEHSSTTSAALSKSAANPRDDSGYLLREAIAYWAGFVFDTSASITTGLPSILFTALNGFELEDTVQQLKAATQDFHEKTEDWRANGFQVTNQRAVWITQSASGLKGLFWKSVACLREALNYGRAESEIARAQNAVLECIQRFDTTYAPLLAACQKALIFLDGEAQLHWCKYHRIQEIQANATQISSAFTIILAC